MSPPWIAVPGWSASMTYQQATYLLGTLHVIVGIVSSIIITITTSSTISRIAINGTVVVHAVVIESVLNGTVLNGVAIESVIIVDAILVIGLSV